jgi:hypothetical protein
MKSCMVCEHSDRAHIEDGLLRKVACRKLAAQFGVSPSAIWRHKHHLGRSIVCTGERPLLDRIEALMVRLEKIAAQAETGKDLRAAVCAMREIREAIELLARLTGQMPLPGRSVTLGVAVNINQSHSAPSLNDGDLELQIAMDVAEATRGFDPQEIARLRRLAERNRISDDRTLDVHAAS